MTRSSRAELTVESCRAFSAGMAFRTLHRAKAGLAAELRISDIELGIQIDISAISQHPLHRLSDDGGGYELLFWNPADRVHSGAANRLLHIGVDGTRA
jgi:hypothetical protein